jgi:hypothetical protein
MDTDVAASRTEDALIGGQQGIDDGGIGLGAAD